MITLSPHSIIVSSHHTCNECFNQGVGKWYYVLSQGHESGIIYSYTSYLFIRRIPGRDDSLKSASLLTPLVAEPPPTVPFCRMGWRARAAAGPCLWVLLLLLFRAAAWPSSSSSLSVLWSWSWSHRDPRSECLPTSRWSGWTDSFLASSLSIPSSASDNNDDEGVPVGVGECGADLGGRPRGRDIPLPLP